MRINELSNVNDYSAAVADYLCEEYDDIMNELMLNLEQKNAVGAIINYCYEHEDSVNNAGNYLMEFVRRKTSK
jgi:hypothetical protein|tara:strand:- start:1108 stop:1326 length:219 start_codon:yes stop_codon:yes gene_type:complete